VVTESVRGTHIHPIAIDAAVIIARLVGLYMNNETLSAEQIFSEALEISTDPQTKETLQLMLEIIRKPEEEHHELLSTKSLVMPWKKNGEEVKESFLDFQLRGDIAAAVALYGMAMWSDDLGPEQCLIKTIALGGDVDTIGAMLGAMLGARYGSTWIPRRWFDHAENGTKYNNGEEDIHNPFGRDHIIDLAKKLSKIELK